MHRFYVPPNESQSDSFALTGGEAHHASCVLRVRPQEIITVLDGRGGELRCRVESVQKRSVGLAVIERIQSPPRAFEITLLQAIPKGKLMEAIIQKATELGVSRIVPLLSERAATRLNEHEAVQKQDKWQQAAIEAIKQCGAAWLPQIDTPQAPDAFLQRGERFDLPFVASLQPGARHPKHWFHELARTRASGLRSACVWIGPEGDFSPDEVRAIEASGAHPITLGKLVLRVETAAVYCLSILNHELGDDSVSPQLDSQLRSHRCAQRD